MTLGDVGSGSSPESLGAWFCCASPPRPFDLSQTALKIGRQVQADSDARADSVRCTAAKVGPWSGLPFREPSLPDPRVGTDGEPTIKSSPPRKPSCSATCSPFCMAPSAGGGCRPADNRGTTAVRRQRRVQTSRQSRNNRRPPSTANQRLLAPDLAEPFAEPDASRAAAPNQRQTDGGSC